MSYAEDRREWAYDSDQMIYETSDGWLNAWLEWVRDLGGVSEYRLHFEADGRLLSYVYDADDDHRFAYADRILSKYVVNAHGAVIEFDAAEILMDVDVCERLHARLAPCTNQEFFDAYCEADPGFEFAKPNPQA